MFPGPGTSACCSCPNRGDARSGRGACQANTLILKGIQPVSTASSVAPGLAGRPERGCLVIGEVAQAHDGSLGMAHAYVDAIARAGADAVKFQTHIAAAESTLAEPWRVQFSRRWAAMLGYELDRYHALRPIAYTNWPTLDPLHHPTESTAEEERRWRGDSAGGPPGVTEDHEEDAAALDGRRVRNRVLGERRARREALGRDDFISLETTVKYEGYLKQQEREVVKLRKAESRRLPRFLCRTCLQVRAGLRLHGIPPAIRPGPASALPARRCSARWPRYRREDPRRPAIPHRNPPRIHAGDSSEAMSRPCFAR